LHSAIDSRLLLFALLVSVAAGVLSGFAPALHAGRRSLISSLRERGGALGGARLREIIVTAPMAFPLIPAIRAACCARTVHGFQAKGPGFETSSLVSFGLSPLSNGYTRPQANALSRRIHDEIRASASTEASAIAGMQLLVGGSWNNYMTIQAGQRIV